VVPQYTTLAHDNFCYNRIGSTLLQESLAGVLRQCTTLVRLNLGGNAVGTENLAVVLGSVQRWFISFNVIGAAGVVYHESMKRKLI
jgi:hypothetical protein